MKAVVFDGTRAAFVANREKPVPKEGESLIKVLYAAICNTDREVLKGYRPQFNGVMGHEFVGLVEQSDDAGLVGQVVVGELNDGCGRCLYCKTGREHHCLTRRVLGLDRRDGCFAEYMAYPTRLLHAVPEELPAERAIFCEPLAAALEILEQNHLPPSQPVAVVGDGRLALMITQVVALNGTEVTVFGRHEEKLRLFEGFSHTSLTPKGSFEAVIEATGNPEGLKTAIELTRSCGLLVLKSTFAGLAQVNTSEIVVREITVRGSRCGPFPPALQLLKRELVTLPPVEFYPLEQFEEAFAARAFKAGFRM